MHRSIFDYLLPFAVVAVSGTGAAVAQDYPARPVRIATGEAGGANDMVARLVAQGLTASLAHPVIVENRGGSAAIPARIVARAAPDGHSLLVLSGSLWIVALLQSDSGYSPVNDFAPVTMLSEAPNVLVVHPALPVQSVADLIALAKAKPGALNYASGASGTSTHLAAELFKYLAGVSVTRVPYKGGGPALTDLIGGRVQLMFATGASVAEHRKAGRLRALAITSANPSPLLPGLPTMAASGVAGYESVTMLAVFAPARTSARLITRINAEIGKVLDRPDVLEKFRALGVEPARSTPQQLGERMKADIARMSKLIRDTGMAAEL